MPTASVTIKGMREIRATLKNEIAALADASDVPVGTKTAIARTASLRLSAVADSAAQEFRDAARANERAQGWPDAVVNATFKFNDPNAPKRKNRIAGLVGIRKTKPKRSMGATVTNAKGVYVEWHARLSMTPLLKIRRKKGQQLPVKNKATNAAGKLLGMGLGTIMERGTMNPTAFTRKRWMPRAAFAPAIAAKKQAVGDKFAAGVADVVQWIAASRATV